MVSNLVRESHVPIKSLLNFKPDRLDLLYFLNKLSIETVAQFTLLFDS